MSRRRMASLVGALALSVGATATATGAATAAPESGKALGSTRVAIAPAAVKYLTKANVTPSATGKAKAFTYNGTLAVRFPISDVAMNGNRIKHVGGVALTAGKHDIMLKRFWIDLNRGKVSGLVNGGDRADLFKLAKSNRAKLGDVRLVLTRAAAGALNKTFDVHHFSRGANFGFATVNLNK